MYEDNGQGIPHDEKPRIFRQGYGKNTGYGLFHIHEILALTSMTIRECREPGAGARFEIQVPPAGISAWNPPAGSCFFPP
ncbi:MAG: hypothetical protein LUQ13_04010 [Methanomicrobiales archaeon]|nr:hypothetical protein [Methanomicrobiales archaeon]